MQLTLRKLLKIVSYALLALVAFCVSYLLGGNRSYGITQKGDSAGLTLGLPQAHAEVAPGEGAGSTTGAEGWGSCSSEGTAGGEGEGGGGGEGGEGEGG